MYNWNMPLRKIAFFLLAGLLMFTTSCSEKSSGDKEANPKYEFLNQSNAKLDIGDKEAYQSLKLKVDDFSGVKQLKLPDDLHMSAETSKYNSYSLWISLSSNGDPYTPILNLLYWGDEFQQTSSLQIKVGETIVDLVPGTKPKQEVIRGATSVGVLEQNFFFLDESTVDLLGGMTNNKPLKFRVINSNYTDFVPTTREIEGLRTILLAYRYMYQHDLLFPSN